MPILSIIFVNKQGILMYMIDDPKYSVEGVFTYTGENLFWNVGYK